MGTALSQWFVLRQHRQPGFCLAKLIGFAPFWRSDVRFDTESRRTSRILNSPQNGLRQSRPSQGWGRVSYLGRLLPLA